MNKKPIQIKDKKLKKIIRQDRLKVEKKDFFELLKRAAFADELL